MGVDLAEVMAEATGVDLGEALAFGDGMERAGCASRWTVASGSGLLLLPRRGTRLRWQGWGKDDGMDGDNGTEEESIPAKNYTCKAVKYKSLLRE